MWTDGPSDNVLQSSRLHFAVPLLSLSGNIHLNSDGQCCWEQVTFRVHKYVVCSHPINIHQQAQKQICFPSVTSQQTRLERHHLAVYCAWWIQWCDSAAVVYPMPLCVVMSNSMYSAGHCALFYFVFHNYSWLCPSIICHDAFQPHDLIWTCEQKHQCAFLISPGGTMVANI